MDDATIDLLQNSSDIVRAYVSRNSLAPADLIKLIGEVHNALSNLGDASPPEPALVLSPAVSIKKSLTPDYLICLEDGKRFRSMKRHLAQLGLTPDEYRSKWSLPSNYPMVAPNYSAKRSALAKENGLERKVVKIRTPRAKAKS